MTNHVVDLCALKTQLRLSDLHGVAHYLMALEDHVNSSHVGNAQGDLRLMTLLLLRQSVALHGLVSIATGLSKSSWFCLECLCECMKEWGVVIAFGKLR